MKLLIISILIIINIPKILSQNLIYNPSFEEYYAKQTSPSYIVDTFFCKHWQHIYNNNHSTPDYYVEGNIVIYAEDKINKAFNVPDNDWGYHPAFSGKAYCGISLIFLDSGQIEYLTGELIEPLIQGEKYEVSFYLRFPILYSRLYSDLIEISFSSNSSLFTKKESYNIYAKQEDVFEKNIVKSDLRFDISILKDTTEWIKFNQIYIAKGGEKYITFGLFGFDEATQKCAIDYINTITNIDNKRKRERYLNKLHRHIPFLGLNKGFQRYVQLPDNLDNVIVVGGDFAYYFIDEVSLKIIQE